ncbi:uncharacterized protein LOC115279716 [Suricata suricatta]|uniref:uncharacterized protein LOC115279716 n=1 Tax=Suricata suricatta TaxID=37032 RepID=UPI001155CC35|nr:uncharacterized protein LOC115279716 [Suricata suricatta]
MKYESVTVNPWPQVRTGLKYHFHRRAPPQEQPGTPVRSLACRHAPACPPLACPTSPPIPRPALPGNTLLITHLQTALQDSGFRVEEPVIQKVPKAPYSLDENIDETTRRVPVLAPAHPPCSRVQPSASALMRSRLYILRCSKHIEKKDPKNPHWLSSHRGPEGVEHTRDEVVPGPPGPMWQHCQSIFEKSLPFRDQEPLGAEKDILGETGAMLESMWAPRKEGGQQPETACQAPSGG